MKLNYNDLKNTAQWEAAGIKLPGYDVQAMVAATTASPIWIHFGSGNIFRGFIAQLQQTLLNKKVATKGIVAVDTFDYDIIDKI